MVRRKSGPNSRALTRSWASAQLRSSRATEQQFSSERSGRWRRIRFRTSGSARISNSGTKEK